MAYSRLAISWTWLAVSARGAIADCWRVDSFDSDVKLRYLDIFVDVKQSSSLCCDNKFDVEGLDCVRKS